MKVLWGLTEVSHIPWPELSSIRQPTSTRNEEGTDTNGRAFNGKSPLVSDDPRLHQHDSNKDGHHMDVKAVSQDTVALDRVELLRELWQQCRT